MSRVLVTVDAGDVVYVESRVDSGGNPTTARVWRSTGFRAPVELFEKPTPPTSLPIITIDLWVDGKRTSRHEFDRRVVYDGATLRIDVTSAKFTVQDPATQMKDPT